MDKFWSEFFVQTLAGLAVFAIVGIISYARSEKFRKSIKSALSKVGTLIKWWARQWKYNLAALLLLLLEFAVYSFFKSLSAIIFSVLHMSLIAFLYKLFQPKPLVLMNQSSDLFNILISHHWVLVFSPPDQSKPISFLPNGTVGDGRNQNEHTWRIQKGKLELLQEDGRVHSRFNFDKKAISFTHTNEPDTLSIKSQTIHPV
jgi:hypothetical protein